jgi:hypothetical protein
MAKILNNFKPFDVQQYETTVIATLLRQIGIELF